MPPYIVYLLAFVGGLGLLGVIAISIEAGAKRLIARHEKISALQFRVLDFYELLHLGAMPSADAPEMARELKVLRSAIGQLAPHKFSRREWRRHIKDCEKKLESIALRLGPSQSSSRPAVRQIK